MAALHERAYCDKTPRNVGQLLSQDDGLCAREVFDKMFQDEPEESLLDYLAQRFDLTLTSELRSKVLAHFDAFWRTVKGAPHFDEFQLLLSDASGQGLSYGGCISVHFADFLSAASSSGGKLNGSLSSHNTLDVVYATNQAVTAVQRAQIMDAGQAFAQLPLPLPTNSCCVDDVVLTVNTLRLVELVAHAEERKVAELLLSKYVDEESGKAEPLYKKLLQDGVLLGREEQWPAIRSMMLAMIPDDALREFSSFVGGVMVWFRITGYIARSLYTQVSANGHFAQLNLLSNEERPDKLLFALLCIEVELDQDRIQMSEHYDGYTVHATQEQMDTVMRVHELQRRNFHLTQEIAVRLYKEVGRRYGLDSDEYREMNGYNNWALSPLEHPQSPGITLHVPQKIFKACALLDIVIPSWTFNGYDGYFISSDDPAMIDALERTAEWSRQQQDVIAGTAAPPAAHIATRGGRRGRFG